jgi:DNA modification methylase
MLNSLKSTAVEYVSPAPGIHLFLGDSRTMLENAIWEGGDPIVDMVLSDPPYGIDYVSNTGLSIANDKEPPLWCIEQMVNTMKPNTPMWIFTREDVSPQWRDEMSKQGLRIKPSYIWVKGSGGQGDCVSDDALNYEMILVGHKGRALLRHWVDSEGWKGQFGFPPDGTVGKLIKRDDKVWLHNRPKGKGAYSHPTTKPVDLMERAIIGRTDVGGLVLDPFMGSSPVGVACVNLSRQYVGIEVDPTYFKLAVTNVTNAVKEKENDW